MEYDTRQQEPEPQERERDDPWEEPDDEPEPGEMAAICCADFGLDLTRGAQYGNRN